MSIKQRDNALETALNEIQLIAYKGNRSLSEREIALMEHMFKKGWEDGRQSAFKEVEEIISETNPLKKAYYKRRYGQ